MEKSINPINDAGGKIMPDNPDLEQETPAQEIPMTIGGQKILVRVMVTGGGSGGSGGSGESCHPTNLSGNRN